MSRIYILVTRVSPEPTFGEWAYSGSHLSFVPNLTLSTQHYQPRPESLPRHNKPQNNMKRFFSLALILMGCIGAMAQNTLVATLSHDSEITMYYGAYALRDAVNAAQSGDIINISGGAFLSVDITKAITLRGTGIDDPAPSYISGNFYINIPAEDENRFTMEGIRCTGQIYMRGAFKSPYFVKSAFSKIYFDSNSAIKNAVYANCRITENFYLNGNSSAQFINSYIVGFYNPSSSSSGSGATLINCIIKVDDSNSLPDYINSSQLINCILYNGSSDGNRQLPSSTMATNCLAIGYYGLFGQQEASTGNYAIELEGFSNIFKTFTGTYSKSEQFELTEEAKSTYIGTDGTEIGIHGGILPYNTTPSYPQISKMNVANKTTADGKLSVDIEVNAAE